MRFAAFASVSIMAAVLFAAPPARAAASEHGLNAFAVEISAQAVTVRTRPRTRLRVTPRYPCRNYHTFYPLPYDIECPGPNTVRLCDFKLVQERRPGGTVIVPRQRCWWARQR